MGCRRAARDIPSPKTRARGTSMLRSDLLLGSFETVETVHAGERHELLKVAGGADGTTVALVLVPSSAERGRLEHEMLALMRTPGVPVCERTVEVGEAVAALVLEEAQE